MTKKKRGPKKVKDNKVILKVDLPEDLIKQIESVAKKEGKTFDQVVNEALECELNKLEEAKENA